jgi:hypothetical protein
MEVDELDEEEEEEPSAPTGLCALLSPVFASLTTMQWQRRRRSCPSTKSGRRRGTARWTRCCPRSPRGARAARPGHPLRVAGGTRRSKSTMHRRQCRRRRTGRSKRRRAPSYPSRVCAKRSRRHATMVGASHLQHTHRADSSGRPDEDHPGGRVRGHRRPAPVSVPDPARQAAVPGEPRLPRVRTPPTP